MFSTDEKDIRGSFGVADCHLFLESYNCNQNIQKRVRRQESGWLNTQSKLLIAMMLVHERVYTNQELYQFEKDKPGREPTLDVFSFILMQYVINLCLMDNAPSRAQRPLTIIVVGSEIIH